MSLLIVLFLSLASQNIFANKDPFVQLSLLGGPEKVVEQLKDISKKTTSVKDRKLSYLGIGIRFYEMKQYDKALAFLKKSFGERVGFEGYTYYYLGLTYRSKSRLEDAKKSLLKINSKNSNRYLKRLSILELVKVDIQKRYWRKAYENLRFLERKMRSDKEHPEILGLLSYVERKRKREWGSCRWAKKLYRQYPNDQASQKWEEGLKNVKIHGTSLNCIASFSDQKKRIRRLQLIGQSKKARREVEKIKKNYGKESYKGDLLQAGYLSQEGHPKEALKLLLFHYEKKRKDFEFLGKLAQISSRAGDFELAISIYDHLYKLSPERHSGKKALYKAAFISYQYGDYDGAIRRFSGFIKIGKKSSLSSHARWYVAWMNYLKGNNELSYRLFTKILYYKKHHRRYWRPYSSDKIRYWLAMSAYKRGSFEVARKELQKLSDKGIGSYYSMLAKSRLEIFENEKDEKNSLERTVYLKENLVSRGGEPSGFDIIRDKNKNKNETTFDKISEEKTNLRNKKFKLFFGRAQDMKRIGLYDWAKWDLYEIERRTKSKELLEILMGEYHSLEVYHRSAYIGQKHFKGHFKEKEISRKNVFWNYAYPKAYTNEVKQAGDAHGIDEEFVWAIMRAESNYRSYALSPVGARGLMQVMPYTGKKMANVLEIPFSPEDLFKPEKGVYLGASYLKRLMGKFQSTVPLVAAAYNAGPHRVIRWARHFGEGLELDEFIDHIPFIETRNYVKKVIQNYHIYSFLGKSKKKIQLAKRFKVPYEGPIPLKENWDAL